MDEKNAPVPRRTRATRIFFLLALALLNACSGSTDAARALPVPTASADFEQRKDNMFLVEPVSAPIEQGVEYEFEIHTHCGLANAWVDVDGSLWDFDGPMEGEDSARLDGFDDPSDKGTIELTDDDRLKYTSSGGAEAQFTRHEGTKKIPGCE